MAGSTKSHLFFFAAAALTVMMTSLPCGDAWQKDIKVKYYSNAILRCHEKETTIPNNQVFWITPDNVVVNATSPTAGKNVALVNGSVVSMIDVTNVDDDLFGYYTCVMIHDATKQVTLARWGLNVDGADFSDLEKEYRENAVVGAIAASVMLVLVGGACLVWHYRYHKRGRGKGESKADEDDLKKDSATTEEVASHVNKGFDDSNSTPVTTTAAVDIEMVEPEAARDMSNGSSATAEMDVKM